MSKEIIDEMIDEMQNLVFKPNFDKQPGAKALLLLSEGFYKQRLPLKFIGRIRINVNDDLFEDEEKARQFIMLFCEYLAMLRGFCEHNFGEDSEIIFGDMLYNMSLDYIT